MIRTPHATFLQRSGLLILKRTLAFVPERQRAPLVSQLQSCDRLEAFCGRFDASTDGLILLFWTGAACEHLVIDATALSPSAADFARVLPGLIVRIQRRWRAALHLRAVRRREVLVQALHPRLGAASPLATLTHDALRLVAARV